MADPRYGKFEADGSVTEPEVSILTETRIVKEGSISELVGKTTFVRYEGGYADRVTDELRAKWRSEAPGEGGRVFGKGKNSEENNS